MIKVCIIGGSGFTGKELIKILSRHKGVKITGVTSLEYPGVEISSIFPELNGLISGKFLDAKDEGVYSGVDLAFLCLPHAAAMGFVNKCVQKGIKAVDFSADFRIKDPAAYKKWYNKEHEYTDLLKEAVYGLPELYREQIKKTRVLANPGCYPTSILLGSIPAIKNIGVESMIIDAKSSVSGAGINPTPVNHFLNVHDNIFPYNTGRKHRHLGEVEDLLKLEFGRLPDIIFTPHVIPASSGILSVIYLKLKAWKPLDGVKKMYADFYKGEPFVRLVDKASLHNVQKTNFCEICVDGVEESRTLIIAATLDNLIKGASGQAVQNMNLMCGFDETEALL